MKSRYDSKKIGMHRYIKRTLKAGILTGLIFLGAALAVNTFLSIYFSQKPLPIHDNSFLLKLIPNTIKIRQATIQKNSFWDLPIVTAQNLCLTTHEIEVKTPSCVFQWTWKNLLSGQIFPAHIHLKSPVFRIFDQKDTPTSLSQVFSIIKTLPFSNLNIENGVLYSHNIHLSALNFTFQKKFLHSHLDFQTFLNLSQPYPIMGTAELNHLTSFGSLTLTLQDFLLPEHLDFFDHDYLSFFKKHYPDPIKGTCHLSTHALTNTVFLEADLLVKRPGSPIDLDIRAQWQTKTGQAHIDIFSPALTKEALQFLYLPFSFPEKKELHEKIQKGSFVKTSVNFDFSFLEQNPLKKFSGKTTIQDGTILFHPGFPPLKEVEADISFNMSSLKSYIKKASLLNLIFSESYAKILFSEENPLLKMSLVFERDLSSLVTLLKNPLLDIQPLHLIQQAQGHVIGDLRITTPLNASSATQYTLDGQLICRDAYFKLEPPSNLFLINPFIAEKSHLTLDFKKQNLTARGTTVVQNIRHQGVFTVQNGIRHFTLRSNGPLQNFCALFKKFPTPLLSGIGPFSSQLSLISSPEKTQLRLQANLKESSLQSALLNWKKPASKPGTLSLSYSGETPKHPSLLKSTFLSADAKTVLAMKKRHASPNYGIRVTNYPHKKKPGIRHVQGTCNQNNCRWRLNLPSLNLSVLKSLWSFVPMQSSNLSSDLTAFVGQALIDQEVVYKNLSLSLASREGSLESFILKAESKIEPLKAIFETTGKQEIFSFHTENPNPLLKILMPTTQLTAKSVLLKAMRPVKSKQPFKGTFFIQDPMIKQAPFLARLFSILSLDGLLTQLSGQGIAFKKGSANFEYIDQKIALSKAKFTSASLGITAQGYLDLKKNSLSLDGVVIPFNFINQLLGNIPLFGKILTGGTDNGVFSMSYNISGTLDDPRIQTNPLSLLAPNILDIFKTKNTPQLSLDISKN